MWVTAEDGIRYRELSKTLSNVLEEESVLRGEQRVEPDDLCLYLEWLELAREAAISITPFVDKSSPFVLSSLTYRRMAADFRYLCDQIHCDEEDEAPIGFATSGPGTMWVYR